jgi:hypothetical protein
MRLLLAGTVIAILAVAAGCGGSSASPTEQWAGNVCDTLDTWATQIQGYATDVQTAVSSPSADSISTVQSTIAKGADATNQMVKDIKALGPPPSTSGQSTNTTLDDFTSKVEQTSNEVQAQAQSIQGTSNLTAIASALGTIATDVSALVADGKTTFQSLENANSELKDAFSNTDSCKQLQKDFGG